MNNINENTPNKTYQTINNSQRVYLVFKRIIDIFGSFIGIIVLSLLMIIIAIIVKCTSKGPILFKQERYGQHLKVFKCLKFRSMHVNVEEKAPSDMSKEEHDKMVTKWGKIMRKTSLDELPQLFNIFIGQMSFVGPRPGASHNEENLKEMRLSQEYNPYDVKPGLTGYAQVYMKREHQPLDKAWFDSEYVKKLSFGLDTKLFIKTILKIFKLGK